MGSMCNCVGVGGCCYEKERGGAYKPMWWGGLY